jgi:histidyl-tRNA synthetase
MTHQAVGVSIGIERVMAIMEELEKKVRAGGGGEGGAISNFCDHSFLQYD